MNKQQIPNLKPCPAISFADVALFLAHCLNDYENLKAEWQKKVRSLKSQLLTASELEAYYEAQVLRYKEFLDSDPENTPPALHEENPLPPASHREEGTEQ